MHSPNGPACSCRRADVPRLRVRRHVERAPIVGGEDINGKTAWRCRGAATRHNFYVLGGTMTPALRAALAATDDETVAEHIEWFIATGSALTYDEDVSQLA